MKENVMSYATPATCRRSAAHVFWLAVLVTGAAAAAMAGVATGFVPLLLPGLLLAVAYVVPAGNARVALRTLASIGVALAAAVGALVLLLIAAFAGGHVG
jgi:hypothetical protein